MRANRLFRWCRPGGLFGECYPIDFTDIDIEWYAGEGAYQLTVSWVKPDANMEVSLSHEAYSGRPVFWRTLVIGCVKNGLVLPIATPYLRHHAARPVRGHQGHRDHRSLA